MKTAKERRIAKARRELNRKTARIKAFELDPKRTIFDQDGDPHVLPATDLYLPPPAPWEQR